jgi:hypothetical protein
MAQEVCRHGFFATKTSQRALEEENRKLKQMFADVSLDNKMLKDVLSKKW